MTPDPTRNVSDESEPTSAVMWQSRVTNDYQKWAWCHTITTTIPRSFWLYLSIPLQYQVVKLCIICQVNQIISFDMKGCIFHFTKCRYTLRYPRGRITLLVYPKYDYRDLTHNPANTKCWSSVVDGGPTLNQHWFNVLCLLGISTISNFTGFNLGQVINLGHVTNKFNYYARNCIFKIIKTALIIMWTFREDLIHLAKILKMLGSKLYIVVPKCSSWPSLWNQYRLLWYIDLVW